MMATDPPPYKADADKPLVSLILCPGGVEIAKALTYGAKTYSRYNYLHGKGMEYNRLLDAGSRHLAEVVAGHDIDPTSGLLHAAHWGANAVMLTNLLMLGRGVDDRWRPFDK